MNDDLPQEQEIHLRDYFQVIKKRKAIVLTFAFITIALVLLTTFSQTPLYTAKVEILIERNYDTELMGRGYTPYDPEFYGTQFNIIQSRNVVSRVVKKLKLDTRYRHYFFKPETTSLLQPVKDWVSSTIKAFLPQGDPDAIQSTEENIEISPLSDAQIITAMIQAGLSAKPIPTTKIVVISYTNETPAMAQLVVNNIAKAYMDEMLEIKMNASSYAIEWMTIKAKEEKKKLEDSEKTLQQYTRDHDIITVENKMTIVPQKLREFSTQQSIAEAEMQQLREVYLQVKNAGDNLEAIESIPVVTANKTLQSLRDALLKSEQLIDELSKKYGPKHPVMIKAVSDRDHLIIEKKNELKRIERAIETDYKLARSKSRNLQELLDQAKQDLLNLKERFIQYDILKREVDTNHVLYDALVGRIKQQSASEQTQTVNIWVVKKADLPDAPSSPRKKRNLMLAIILGVFGGIGMAFFIEYLDNTIKSASDIESRTGLPILGLISAPKKGEDIATIIKNDPKSLLAESYRSIRSQVLLSAAEQPPKTILICSVTPGEGKTTTAVNIARTLAQANKSVLIIDCDMRKPRLHKLLQLPNTVGLSTFLSGTNTEVPILPMPDEPVHIIPSGPIPPNPSELLTSNQMLKLMAAMRARYDFVIIDSPPVMSVTDSQILSKMVDGTILVVRYGKTTWDQLQHGTKLFTDVQASMLGIILNGVEAKGMEGGYYYQGYYAYYGDDAKS